LSENKRQKKLITAEDTPITNIKAQRASHMIALGGRDQRNRKKWLKLRDSL